MSYSVNEREEKTAFCEYLEAEKCYRMSALWHAKCRLNSIIIQQKVILV